MLYYGKRLGTYSKTPPGELGVHVLVILYTDHLISCMSGFIISLIADTRVYDDQSFCFLIVHE